MFGYTEDELEANFEEHLRAHAAKIGKAYEDYRADARPVWLIGLSFDSKTRQLVDCIAEKMNFSTETTASK